MYFLVPKKFKILSSKYYSKILVYNQTIISVKAKNYLPIFINELQVMCTI